MSLEIVAEKAPLKTDRDGIVRIAQTRVTLDTVVAAFREGATAEEIVQQYPTLRLSEVYATIAFYLGHQAAVDAYLHERECQGERVRQENERRFDPNGIRARLLARRAERKA